MLIDGEPGWLCHKRTYALNDLCSKSVCMSKRQRGASINVPLIVVSFSNSLCGSRQGVKELALCYLTPCIYLALQYNRNCTNLKLIYEFCDVTGGNRNPLDLETTFCLEKFREGWGLCG